MGLTLRGLTSLPTTYCVLPTMTDIRAAIETDKGTINLSLVADQAPFTVARPSVRRS